MRAAARAAAVLLLGSLGGCGASTPTAPATPNPGVGFAGDGRLEALLDEQRQQDDLPAMGGMIVRGDRVVEVGAVGLRALGFTERVTTADQWHVGSITKSMTATLAGVLVERGRLSWTTRLGEVFPDLVASMRPEYASIPLEELLSHTSGLPNNPQDTASWASIIADRTVPGIDQRDRWLGELLALPPYGPRGSWYYSNIGYVAAGSMIDRVMDEAWEAVVQREVFGPLGMTGAGFGAPGTPGLRDQPWGHARVGGAWLGFPPGPDSDNPPAIGPAGRVHMTFADAARYLSAHLAGARGASNVVSAETFRKLHTPVAPAPGLGSYALGWLVTSDRRIWHDGSNTVWYARVLFAPDRNYALMAVTNAGGEPGYQATLNLIETLTRRAEAAP